MTREKRNATLGNFSKGKCSVSVNEETVEDEICGGKKGNEKVCS